jgi:hypothetical protein
LPQRIAYHVEIVVKKNEKAIESAKEQCSCYVVGTNIEESELSNQEVISAYKGQNTSIENKGFRFLKDALFFTTDLINNEMLESFKKCSLVKIRVNESTCTNEIYSFNMSKSTSALNFILGK